MSTYAYGPGWKSSVDRDSEDWRIYCEAISLLRQYLRNCRQVGKRAAWDDIQATLANLGKRVVVGQEAVAVLAPAKQDDRQEKRRQRVRTVFLLAGQHEIEDLRAAVEREEVVPVPAEL